MSRSTEEIAPLSPEQRLFVRGENDLEPNFLGQIVVQVPAGEKWLIYCDGALTKQLGPGRHTWRKGFFRKWKAQKINTRTELLSVGVSGRVKGPAVPKDADSGDTVSLACEVTATLEISCLIFQIENFLNYRDPLSIFLASIRNMVVEIIGQLRYDQYGQWATDLRDGVRNRLIGGRDDAERRIGMRVEDVFVTDLHPNTTADRNILSTFQMVERLKRELIEAQENAKRDGVVARSFAGQGEILNIAPSILALQNSPIGKALLERDASLRELMVSAGLNPGISVQPLQDQTGQLGGGQSSMLGYLNPPRPVLPSQVAPGQVTGQLYRSEALDRDASDTLAGTDTGEQPVDSARQSIEVTALQQAGFLTAGKGKADPTSYDANGQPVPGSKEWVLQVSVRRQNDMMVIIFHCPAGYPASPPKVQVRLSTGGGLRWIEPNTIYQWHPGHMLVDVVHEIINDMP